MQSKFLQIILTAIFVLATLQGCAPRGESKSLDEVLAGSKARYSKVQNNKVPSKVESEVKEVSQLLNKIEAIVYSEPNRDTKGDISNSAGKLADAIESLIPFAGYASRPGLNELRTQLTSLAENALGDPMFYNSKAKLLIARTYIAMASEMESSAFNIS